MSAHGALRKTPVLTGKRPLPALIAPGCLAARSMTLVVCARPGAPNLAQGVACLTTPAERRQFTWPES